MAINPRDGFASAGIAHSFSETVARERDALITGDSPSISAIDFPVERNQDLAGLNVVALNNRGRIVPAQFNLLAAAGTEANGTLTITSSTENVTVDGVTYNIPNTGTAAERATALVALINADVDGPVYASSSGTTLTLIGRYPTASGGNITADIGTSSSTNLTGSASGTGGLAPIGVLVEQIDTTDVAADDERPSAAVYVSGVLNPDRLVWHSSFVGEQVRKIAFARSPYGSIIMRKIRAATVV